MSEDRSIHFYLRLFEVLFAFLSDSHSFKSKNYAANSDYLNSLEIFKILIKKQIQKLSSDNLYQMQDFLVRENFLLLENKTKLVNIEVEATSFRLSLKSCGEEIF